MNEFAVTAAVMAASDRACIEGGTSSLDLMQRAAEGIAKHIPRGGSVYVFCGKGNNGGDGYACARVLSKRGEKVAVFALSDDISPDSAHYRALFEAENPGAVRPIGECDYRFDVALDCLFGTGFRGAPKGVYAEVIDRLNAADGLVVAADIASGLDGTSGVAVKAVEADVTVAVQTFKTGHFLNDGKDFSGRVVAEDIGIPVVGARYAIVGEDDVKALFPKRKNNTNKGSYGKCAIVGGCQRYVGAVKLAAAGETALRSGAGLCSLCVPRSIFPAIARDAVECTLMPMPDSDGALAYDEAALDEALKRVDTVAVGMGMGANRGENLKILKHIFSRPVKVVVDADGLNALSEDVSLLDDAAADILVTPHPGEFARLTGKSIGDVLAHPIAHAEGFARAHRCAVLLKGASTFVTDGGRGAIVVNGSPALSKGGSGDTLSGAITGIAAQGNSLFDSACAAAWLCAEAAKRAAVRFGEQGVLASDVAVQLKNILGR